MHEQNSGGDVSRDRAINLLDDTDELTPMPPSFILLHCHDVAVCFLLPAGGRLLVPGMLPIVAAVASAGPNGNHGGLYALQGCDWYGVLLAASFLRAV